MIVRLTNLLKLKMKTQVGEGKMNIKKQLIWLNQLKEQRIQRIRYNPHVVLLLRFARFFACLLKLSIAI